MKKLSLLLAIILSLLCTWGWAQTIVTTPRVSTAQVKYTYTMHCKATDHGGSYLGIVDGSFNGRCAEANACHFEFELKADGRYYIKSVDLGYLTANNSTISFSETPSTYWTFRADDDGGTFLLANGVDEVYLNNNKRYGDGIQTSSGPGDCSHWVFTEYEEGQPLSWSKPIVDGATYAIVNVQPSNSATRYYYLNNSNGTLTPVDATDKNTLSEWPTTAQFVAKDLGNGKFAFKNKSDGMYLGYRTFTSAVEDCSSWTMHESERSGFENTYWFGCDKRDAGSNLTGALIISNGGAFDNCTATEYTQTTNYSNNFGFVLLKEADAERIAVTNEYETWKATLYDGQTLRIGAPASSQLEFMDLAIENEEEYDGTRLRGRFDNVKTTNYLNLPTGYYYFRSIATDNNRNQPYLYNNYFLDNNTKHHTLQSESKPETNAAIWYVVNNGTSITIKNGDGQPLVQGNQSERNNGEVTARETLTFGAFNATYFTNFGNKGIYFTEALNAANNIGSYSVNNSKESLFVTTWTGHSDARDNHWTFEPVEDCNIYNVVIVGAPDDASPVVRIKETNQYAFNGGFFNAASITEEQLEADDIDELNYLIEVVGNTITVTYSESNIAHITYIYKQGEDEWLRESFNVEKGADYPDLRPLPSGVKISTIPYGKVSGSETIDIECTVDDKYDVPFSASYSDAKWLYAKTNGGTVGYWNYNASTQQVGTGPNTFANAKGNESYMWAIIGNPIAGYQIVNKAAGAEMILTSASPANDDRYTYPIMSSKNSVPVGHKDRWSINMYESNSYGYLIAREGESTYLNRRAENILAYWTGHDDGSRVSFYPVNEVISPIDYNFEKGKTYQARNYISGEIISNVNSINNLVISQGRIANCYHLSNVSEITNTPDVFYATKKTDATSDYKTNWSSLSNFSEWYIEEKPDEPTEEHTYTDVSSLTSGKYYRLMSYIDATRFITENNGVLYAYPTSDSGYDQIWKFTDSGSNWTMQNLLSQNYVQSSKNGNNAYTAGSSEATIVLTNKGTASDGRTYFLLAPSTATTGYFNNSKSAQSYRIVPWNSTTDTSNYWYIQEVNISEDDIEAANVLRTEMVNKANILANASTYNTTLQTFFSDNACTQLKDEYANMTDEELRTAMSALPVELQEMAVRVKNDKWDENATKNRYVKDFRIHSYDIYSDPDVWADKTKVGGFSSLFHPTGITCKAGELLYILVGDDVKDSDAVLEIGIAEATHNGPSQTVEVHAGLNIILPNVDGEAFVIYRLTDSEKYLKDYPTIKVHFANGEASGCFDMHRGHTNNDWAYLCSNMFTNKYLHIMGEHTVFSVESDRVRGAENIIGSLKIWDYIFMTEEKLIGHDGQWNGRYNPVVGARDQYSGNPNWGGTSANYSGIWKEGLLNYNSLLNGDRWVIYHEEAHGHQYPVNLAAMTESSNNGFAQMVNHEFGVSSRRADGTKTLMTFKNDGLTWVDILRGGEGANRGNKYYEESLWLQNHLFYQLYLYFHVAGNMPDFWPRLCDKMRANGGIIKSADVNNPTLYSNDYLKFARACAEVSKTDLWEFFDAYGFFGFYEDVFVGNDITEFKTKDVDATATRYVGDYGHYYMRMPSKNNDTDKAYIAELKDFMHSQPNKAPNIMFIDDHIKDRVVADTAFAVTLDPSLAGQPVKFYDSGTGKQGDFGDMSDFNGQNEASNLDYSISGTTVTMSGTGLVGVKIYDADGNLKYIYNTESFEVPEDVAAALADGNMTLVAALGNDTNLPLAKPSAKKYEMAVYNGKDDDMQSYKVSGVTVNSNIPYSATTTGTDVPMLTGNAVALLYRDVDDYSSLPDGLQGNNVFTKTKAGTGEEPVWNAMTMQFTDKADFYLPEDGTFTAGVVNYPRTNTSGLNSVCLPFAIDKTNSGLPSGSKIYTLNDIDNTSISFSEVDEVAAGEFCIIDCPSESTWDLGGTEITLIGTPTDGESSVGSFQNKTIGAGYYKLSSDGTKFGVTTEKGNVTAFRGYISAPVAGVKSLSVSLLEKDDTPVERIELDLSEDNVERTYDLNGRRVLKVNRPGIYVKNGKKFVK